MAVTARGVVGEIPLLFAGEDFTITTSGCRDGLLDHEVTDSEGEIVSRGSTWDYGTGRFAADVDGPPRPGPVRVELVRWCPDGTSPPDVTFDALVDSSGTVVDTRGVPLPGATVTLQAGPRAGPFQAVPGGDSRLGPASPVNPVLTPDDGTYHWNPAPGTYRVIATKAGCHAPDELGTPAATGAHFESGMPTFPRVVLDCGEPASASTTTVRVATPLGLEARREGELRAEVASPVGSPMGTIDFTAAGAPLPGCTGLPVEAGTAVCAVTFSRVPDSSVAVVAAYSGSHGHRSSAGTLDLTVGRTTPEITYGEQPRLHQGQPLSELDLRLSADVPGRFRLQAPLTTVLPAGYQQVGFLFVPDDDAQYRPVEDSVTVHVVGGSQTPSRPTPSGTPTRAAPSSESPPSAGGTTSAHPQRRPDRTGPVPTVSTTVTTPGAERLVVAFISMDSPSCEQQAVTRITGGGLTWTRVTRETSGPRTGATEIWQAHATGRLDAADVVVVLRHPGDAQLDVATFAGASQGVGAVARSHGRGTTAEIRLTPTAEGSSVYVVGHLADVAAEVTGGEGTAVLGQRANRRINDSYWTARGTAPTVMERPVALRTTSSASGTWHVAAVEIPGTADGS